MDPNYEPAKEVVLLDSGFDNSFDSVTDSVPTSPKSKKFDARLVATPIATCSKKIAPSLSKRQQSPRKRHPLLKKQRASKRYAASSFGNEKFCDEYNKYMWDIVCQRKLLNERLINVDEHKKAEVHNK